MGHLPQHLAAMALVQSRISETLPQVAAQADAGQWEMAAYELGRLEKLAGHLEMQCRTAIEALWLDSRPRAKEVGNAE